VEHFLTLAEVIKDGLGGVIDGLGKIRSPREGTLVQLFIEIG